MWWLTFVKKMRSIRWGMCSADSQIAPAVPSCGGTALAKGAAPFGRYSYRSFQNNYYVKTYTASYEIEQADTSNEVSACFFKITLEL